VRVLLVNSSSVMRGGESQTLELGIRLRSRGIETAFAVRAGSELEAALPPGSDSIGARFETPAFLTPFHIRRFIKSWGPDIVHAQTSKAHAYARIACAGRVPLVVSRRTAFRGGKGLASFLKYGKGVAHYIPISKAAARSLRSRGVSDEQMTIVHSGIDIGRFASRTGERAAAKPLIAGTAAAFEKEKGHRVLLDAAAILEARGIRMRYLLAGKGKLEARITARASALGLDLEIHRIGEDLPLERFFEMLDIYALPSLEEGLSTALMAAMASGLPCIASRTGGIPEVTGPDAAILVEPGDPAALADAFERLAGDPLERELLSAAGSERSGLFDVEKMVEGTLEVYERVIERYRT
jgi:glycosyltransferase involved in cell wall biosynthesis